MENKDMVIVGLVVLLVLVVAFAGSLTNTGNTFKKSCTDTDGGWTSFTKGTIFGTDSAGNSFEMTDYCDANNAKYLKEYSCSQKPMSNAGESPEGWYNDLVICDGGCVDGACV